MTNKVTTLTKFLMHPDLEDIFCAFDRLLRYGTLGCDHGRPARCLLLTGPSGSGKSTCLFKFAAENPDIETEDFVERPVLFVQCPARATPKALVLAIHEALQTPLSFRTGSTATLTESAIKMMRTLKVKVLILDEFHHLLTGNTPRAIQEASEYVKSLLNFGVCPIILSGMPDAESIYDENPQLQRRSMGRFELKAFNWNLEDQQAIYRVLVGNLVKNFGFQKVGHLLKIEVVRRLNDAAEGLLGVTHDILLGASIRAEERGDDKLTIADLRESVNDFLSETGGRKNPFDTLNDDGMPFEGAVRQPTRQATKPNGRVTGLHRVKDPEPTPATAMNG